MLDKTCLEEKTLSQVVPSSPLEMKSSLMKFSKMQALGNDFVVILESDLAATEYGAYILNNWEQNRLHLARALCNRHYGIGSDGLIICRKPKRPDCQIAWDYINSDGSWSQMCGNGLRCLALFAHEQKLISDTKFLVETSVGPVHVEFKDCNNITVNLGQPILDNQAIPISRQAPFVKAQLKAGNWTFQATCLSVGNPHCVIFEPALQKAKYAQAASKIQALKLFPEGINVEFVEVLNKQHAKVFVWERGCGLTLACATGAAAVLSAGVLEGRLDKSALIELVGGCLHVEWREAGLHITGPAHQSFSGEINLATLPWSFNES